VYKFFSEKSDNNKINLDSEPFLEVNLLKYAHNAVIEDDTIVKLKKFRKKDFDVEEILCAAEDLKYTNAMKEFFKRQLEIPNDEFVKVVLKGLPFDTKKKNVGEKFAPHVKQALNEIIGDRVAKRIAAAGALENVQTEVSMLQVNDDVTEAKMSESLDVEGVVVSEEEIEAVYIIKAILAELIDISRITYKATTTYVSIIVDNKVTRWACRFTISSRSKFIWVLDEKIRIESLNEIYKHKNLILESVKRYL